MRRVIVLEMVTLDGVMQGPGGAGEDTSGGFDYSGWVARYADEVGGRVVQEELSQTVDFLLGRKTFDIWAAFWPDHADVWPAINDGTKYVLSRTRKKSDWKNTVFIDNLEDIKALKNSDGADIHIWGSGDVVQLLLRNNLVDELRLKIYPLTLGIGKRLFRDGTIPAAFKLTKTVVTPTGVIVAYYDRAEEVQTGTVAH